jgi:hypothetical protein
MNICDQSNTHESLFLLKSIHNFVSKNNLLPLNL